MLAYVLALAVGLGSLAIYMAAFFFPEIHRKNDFIWSGVGLFYALVLWVCAGRITGGVLLGQVAGIALLGWSVSQTLSLRRQLTPSQQQTELPSAEAVKNTVQKKVSNSSFFEKFAQLGKRVSGSATAAKDRLQQNLSDSTPRQSQDQVDKKVQIIDKRTPLNQPVDIATPEMATDAEVVPEILPEVAQPNAPEPNEMLQSPVESAVGEETSAIPEPIRPHPPDPEIVDAAIRDAEEKHQQASPPEPEKPEHGSLS